jgi:anion-transporting  ArsA/GET3 family ATPase
MMLEPSETFDNLISQAVQTDALRKKLLANRLYQLIARTLGGMQEYMAVEKLYDLVDQKKYDLIVIDTPPSVNALVFLDAPRRMYTFFSETIVRFFVKEKEKKKKRSFGENERQGR